jgi:hypothetical protein
MSKTADPEGSRVFRSPAAVALWWVWALFALGNLIDLAVQGRDHLSLVAAFTLIAVTGVLYVTALRPRIVAEADGLTIINPVRVHRVPWAAVAGFDSIDLLRIHCAWPAEDGPATAAAQTGPRKSGLPESGSPETGLPKTGLPEAGLPESGLPESGLPESGLPETDLPETGFPRTGLPETGLPETGLPEAAVAGFGAGQYPAGERKRVISSWAVRSSRRAQIVAEVRARRQAVRGPGRGRAGLGFGAPPPDDAPPPAPLGLDSAKVIEALTERAEKARASAPGPPAVPPQSQWHWPSVAAVVVPVLALVIAALA